MTAVFTSVKISNSYAIFTDSIKGEKTITLTLDKNLDKSGANKPVLSDAMIPVYYDNTNNIWRKADKNNEEKDHKWYDYDKKMWANSVTYDHTKLYNEGTKIEGKTFNGTSDYVDTGVGANVNFGTSFTMVARFKIDENSSKDYDVIISNLNYSNNYGFNLYLNKTSSTINLRLYSKEENKILYFGADATAKVNEWYTVVTTYDGTNLKFYVNGLLTKNYELSDTIMPSSKTFWVGANPTSPNYYFNGTISDALVINDVIDENTIKKNFSGEVTNIDNLNQLFYSKFDNKIGDVKGAKYTNEGMTFNGENDYVDVGLANYDFNNKITVASRFKIDRYSSNEFAEYLIGNADSSGFGLQVFTSGTAGIAIYNGSSYTAVASNTKIKENEWNTVVVTYDGKSVKIYLNGKLEKEEDFSLNIIPSLRPIFIGALSNSATHSHYLPGAISDALVMKEALSEEQAKELSKDSNFSKYSSNENTLIYNNLRSYESRENGTEVPMDMISTMQVWIPRYKYKVWNYNENGDKTSEPKSIQITFEEETNKTGDIECKDHIQGEEDSDGTSETCTLKTTQEKCTDDTCNGKTYTHPGFTFGDKELTGFWVGKFELSSDTACTPKDNDTLGQNCNLKTISPNVKPNLYSWRGAQISTFETVALSMNDNENKYGFATTDDTHIIMLKEWGAIAYLSHSKYGKDGEVDNNAYYNESDSSKRIMTGCGPSEKGIAEKTTECNTYNTSLGQSASTTGNIYGVYDMAGGSWELAMLNIIGKDGKYKMSGNNSTYNSGYNGKLYDSNKYTDYNNGIAYPDDKYYEQISFGITHNQTETTKRGKLGGMVRETYNRTDTTDGTISWNEDYGRNAYSANPWFGLGGRSNNTLHAGVFASTNMDGNANIDRSSRLIISNIQ